MVRDAFKLVCAEKLKDDYYCSMEKFVRTTVSRTDYKQILERGKSPVANLYAERYPIAENALMFFNDFVKEIGYDSSEEGEYPLSMQEAEAIVYWIYRVYKTIKLRREVTREALECLEDIFAIGELGFSGDVLYVKDRIEINIINSFSSFCDELEWMEQDDYTFFYRGHASVSYILLPSIMRRENWLKHEKDMYNQLMIACSNDFMNCSRHLDYLVEMQHYGLPTRLLDVTRNPLVALYFACESEPDLSGEVIVFMVENKEIKYPGSDVVSIIASLPLFSEKEKTDMLHWISDSSISDKEFNAKVANLLHEIRTEKPAFKDKIKKADVGSAAFVLSEKKNDRIIKQDGAFIICGLFAQGNNPINACRYSDDGKIQLYVIPNRAKARIMEQLDRVSINRAALFPEIEDVADYIKSKY